MEAFPSDDTSSQAFIIEEDLQDPLKNIKNLHMKKKTSKNLHMNITLMIYENHPAENKLHEQEIIVCEPSSEYVESLHLTNTLH